MKYRLYIDEVGNSDIRASDNPLHRYLSLTGLALELEYVGTTVFPSIEALKRTYLDSHPDEPIILHRKEIVHKNYPFANLRDAATLAAFNKDLLDVLLRFDYLAITVVLDKLEYRRLYEDWRFDPYHYCLTTLLERYVIWLEKIGTVGDVMIESRGGAEDRRLKTAFTEVHQSGTEHVGPELFSAQLTSKELKVKAKGSNIAGLQLADLIAHPSFQAAKAAHDSQPLPSNFGAQIAAILQESKYHRSPDGEIEGYGRKWVP